MEIKLKQVPEWLRGREKELPYLCAYTQVYWPCKLMSGWQGSDQEHERIYKAAIEKGVTWQELIGFDGYKDGVLL